MIMRKGKSRADRKGEERKGKVKKKKKNMEDSSTEAEDENSSPNERTLRDKRERREEGKEYPWKKK